MTQEQQAPALSVILTDISSYDPLPAENSPVDTDLQGRKVARQRQKQQSRPVLDTIMDSGQIDNNDQPPPLR